MILPSYFLALLAAAFYFVGFVVIHRYTSAKWFTLEVLFGGLVGLAGLGLGLCFVAGFRFEHYAATYGMLWFCFFFVSGIFYVSGSAAIVRYLAKRPHFAASIAEVYQDCIQAPFLERARFLARVGQADLSNQGEDGHEVRYNISPAGSKNAARIRRIQRIFGFDATGYYSVPNDQEMRGDGRRRNIGEPSHEFVSIAGSAVLGLALAETCVSHGVRLAGRPVWASIIAVLVLGVLFFFATRAVVSQLRSQAGRDPASWALWAPLAVVMLLAQLAGVRYGARTYVSDWVVLLATSWGVLYALWTTPIRSLWPLFLLWIAGVCIWWWAGGTGLLHIEAVDRYLPGYLKQRPWLDALFDPLVEFGNNRSRPVSLVFDFIDYRLVQASIRLGYPHFKMVTYPAFALACMGSAYWFFVRDLRLTRTLSLLLLTLFQSAPAMAFHPLYRSAKIGAALMVIVVFAALYRFIVAAETGMKMRGALPRLAGIWVGCLMMPMFDELGTYSIGMLVASLSVYAVVRRTRMSWVLLATVLSTLMAAYLYRYGVSARLYTWVNGTALRNRYDIDGRLYKTLRLDVLLATGTNLVFDAFRFMFGNISRVVAAAVMLLLVYVCSLGFPVRWGKRATSKTSYFITGLVLLSVELMLVLQFCIMVHFHWAQTREDVRRMYYVLPTLALFLMVAGAALKTVCVGHRRVAKVISVVLALCLAGNIDADQDHYRIVRSGHAKKYFERSDSAVAAILKVQKGAILPPTTDPIVKLVLGK